MRFLFFWLFTFLMLNYNYAQMNQGVFAMGGTTDDYANSVIQTSDGGYALAGETSSYGSGGRDVYVAKLNNAGVLQWTKTIGSSGIDWGYAIIQTTDGGFAITGTTSQFGAGGYDVYVIKLDNAGTLQWSRTIGGAGADQGYSIVQTSDGGYAIGGWSSSFGSGGQDIYVIKLDNTGALQWTKTIGGSSTEWGYSIIQTSDGGYAVGGHTNSYGAGGQDVYVVKLDNAGALQWTRTIGGTSDDAGTSIIQTTDGGYAIGGKTKSYGAGQNDFYFVKLNSGGALQWTRTVGGTNHDGAYGLVQTPDGGYALGGDSWSYGTAQDFYIVKLDNAGALQWSKNIGGTGTDYGWSITKTSDKGYAVAGWTASFGSGLKDIFFVKLDSAGNTCRTMGSGGNAGSGGNTNSGGNVSSGGSAGSGGSTGSGGNITILCQPITASIVSTNVNCYGTCTGTATVTANGGSAPYSYSWNTIPAQTAQTATGLCAGSYTVIVTDASMSTTTATVTITQNTAITLSLTATPSTCGNANGTASVTANGGTGAYTYSWNNSQTTSSISGLTSANYQVTVTDSNGCTQTASIQVNNSPGVTAQINPDSLIRCNGSCNGKLSAFGLLGTPPYQFSWSTGATNGTISSLCMGVYTLTVTDSAGCISSTSFNLTQPALLNSVLNTSNIRCGGAANGTASVIASGGTGSYTYSWTNGNTQSMANNLTPGSYTITITDSSGCSTQQNFSITEPAPLSSTITSIPDTCNTGLGSAQITVSGGVGAYTYSWGNGNTNSSISGLTSGNYSVTVVDNNGCSTLQFVNIINIGSATADAGPDVSITRGTQTTLAATGGGGYSWSPSTGLSCISCENPVANPTTTTKYFVVVTAENGCTALDSVLITVTYNCNGAELDLPNAFSPNNDGQNDMYYVIGLGCIKSFSLMIYNRWGEKIFETFDMSNGWDGTFRGELMNTGVYAYALSAVLDNEEEEVIIKTGNITLLR